MTVFRVLVLYTLIKINTQFLSVTVGVPFGPHNTLDSTFSITSMSAVVWRASSYRNENSCPSLRSGPFLSPRFLLNWINRSKSPWSSTFTPELDTRR